MSLKPLYLVGISALNFRERKTFRYEEENYDFAMKPIASNMISVLLRAVLGCYTNMKKI